jgi:hypothetical protein
VESLRLNALTSSLRARGRRSAKTQAALRTRPRCCGSCNAQHIHATCDISIRHKATASNMQRATCSVQLATCARDPGSATYNSNALSAPKSTGAVPSVTLETETHARLATGAVRCRVLHAHMMYAARRTLPVARWTLHVACSTSRFARYTCAHAAVDERAGGGARLEVRVRPAQREHALAVGAAGL